MKRCYICLSTHNVNAEGRCSLCQTAHDAGRGGVSYGSYQAILYNPEAEQEQKQEAAGFTPGRCRWCGGPMPENAKPAQIYCSVKCRRGATRAKNHQAYVARQEFSEAEKQGMKACGARAAWEAREMY